MFQVTGPTRGARRRPTVVLGAIVASAMLVGAGLTVNVLAVHDAGLFELDTSGPPIVGNANTADDPAGGADDWANVYKSKTGLGTAGPDHAFARTFKTDPVGSAEDSYYTGGGSKDVRDIPAWQYGTTNDPVPDKDDIAHLFAAAYTDPADDHTILYFGIDRFDNNGDAETGFWFFQNLVGLDGSGHFTGTHAVGDILVLADWGGSNPVGQMTVYSWVGGKNPLLLLFDSTAADCATAGPGDQACAVVNRATDSPPWPFLDKAGSGSIRPLELFEAGIDLNQLLGEDRCFSTILGATRSSHSTTAQLKDFAIDTFEQCGASIATQVSDTSFVIGDPVTDDATVAVSGGATPPAPTGDIAFSVSYEGGAPSSLGTKPLSGAVKSGDDYTVTSDAYYPANAGEYCFSASWDGDSNYTAGPYVDDGTNECFTVAPNEPGVTTQVNTEDPVTPGTEIYDTATLSGTAAPSNSQGGTITFYAYGPEADANTCTAPAAYTSVVDVTGDGDYDSNTGTGGAFEPTEPGNYNWVAVYAPDSGDVNNLGDATECGDANEGSVVEQFQPEQTTAQTWTVFDTMTITVGGGGDLDGTAYFELYPDSTCTGTPLYDESVAISGGGTTASTTAQTFTADATLYWKVWYESNNSAHADIAATCTENSTLEVNN